MNGHFSFAKPACDRLHLFTQDRSGSAQNRQTGVVAAEFTIDDSSQTLRTSAKLQGGYVDRQRHDRSRKRIGAAVRRRHHATSHFNGEDIVADNGNGLYCDAVRLGSDVERQLDRMLGPRIRVGERNNVMSALLLQSIGKERCLLLAAAVRIESGVNSMIDEVIRTTVHLLKGAKMVGLVLFQAIAAVPLIDKPPYRTVAAKDVFQVFRFKDKGIRLRGKERNSPP